MHKPRASAMMIRSLLAWSCVCLVASTSTQQHELQDAIELLVDNTTSVFELPNLEWVGAGYDILRGNPRPDGLDAVDPGWRQQIFDIDSENKVQRVLVNRVYLVPRGYEVKDCASCESRRKSTTSTSTSNYQKSLESSARTYGKGWGAKFKASATYKQVEEGYENRNEIMIESSSTCRVFCVRVTDNASPKLTENFRAAVDRLPIRYDAEVYNKFIRDFGTHFSRYVELGALSGLKLVMAKHSYSQMQSQGVDVETQVSYATIAFKGGASAKVEFSNEASEQFTSSVSHQTTYSLGGSSGVDPIAKRSEWEKEAIARPFPLTFDLEQITAIFHAGAFPDDTQIKTKQRNVIYALTYYCKSLEESGDIRDCAQAQNLGVEKVGTIGDPDSGEPWSDEIQWKRYGSPPLSQIDVPLGNRRRFFGLKPSYADGKDATGKSKTRMAKGVEIGFEYAKTVNIAGAHRDFKFANDQCRSSRGVNDPTAQLLSISNQRALELFNRGTTTPKSVWIGGYQDNSGNFYWLNGESAAPDKFNLWGEDDGEPGFKNGQKVGHCVSFRIRAFPKWKERGCNEKLPAVCGVPFPTRSIVLDRDNGETITRAKVCALNSSSATTEAPSIQLIEFTTSKGRVKTLLQLQDLPCLVNGYFNFLPGNPNLIVDNLVATTWKQCQQECTNRPSCGKWIWRNADHSHSPNTCQLRTGHANTAVVYDKYHLSCAHDRCANCRGDNNDDTTINDTTIHCETFDFTSRLGLLYMSGTTSEIMYKDYRLTRIHPKYPMPVLQSLSFHQYEDILVEDDPLSGFVDVTDPSYIASLENSA